MAPDKNISLLGGWGRWLGTARPILVKDAINAELRLKKDRLEMKRDLVAYMLSPKVLSFGKACEVEVLVESQILREHQGSRIYQAQSVGITLDRRE